MTWSKNFTDPGEEYWLRNEFCLLTPAGRPTSNEIFPGDDPGCMPFLFSGLTTVQAADDGLRIDFTATGGAGVVAAVTFVVATLVDRLRPRWCGDEAEDGTTTESERRGLVEDEAEECDRRDLLRFEPPSSPDAAADVLSWRAGSITAIFAAGDPLQNSVDTRPALLQILNG